MTNRPTRSILVTIALGLLVAGVISATHLMSATAAGLHKGHEKKIAAQLLEQYSAPFPDEQTINVVIQLRKGNRNALEGFLNANSIHLSKEFKNLDSATVDLPIRLLPELAAFDEVHFVSGDHEVLSFGHVSSTTGADDVRSVMPNGDSLDATGLGIAIVDSGIYSQHRSFNGRVIFSKDFTGENRTDDPFGHGTHVAGAAAGNSAVQEGSYTGIASNANLINLRVLNSQGTGKVSNVLSALDWIHSNHRAYNIRVVVMSLGGAAVSSYKNDPLCLAVRRLVDAGVVVVAAAGNDGKDRYGRKQYGAIHSPGNEPSAITVGATNSFGTDARNDDAVTSYSSRGPTRSYWTDDKGVKHYDNLIKPDLVAPGNKLVFAASPNSLLSTDNPTLDAGLGGGKTKQQQMMYMSGTSVSAPLVAGASAL